MAGFSKCSRDKSVRCLYKFHHIHVFQSKQPLLDEFMKDHYQICGISEAFGLRAMRNRSQDADTYGLEEDMV